MQLTSLFGAAMMAVLTTAASIQNPLSPIPGYPIGTSCLSDSQATFLAEQFRLVLANTDRKAANATAQVLLADTYTETSDSVNILAGLPLGGVSFKSKKDFINGAVNGPALPGFVTTKVYHDCTNLLWQWRLTGLGSNTYPVKGINSFVVAPITGQLQSVNLEFNSIAWGVNTGWTCTAPK